MLWIQNMCLKSPSNINNCSNAELSSDLMKFTAMNESLSYQPSDVLFQRRINWINSRITEWEIYTRKKYDCLLNLIWSNINVFHVLKGLIGCPEPHFITFYWKKSFRLFQSIFGKLAIWPVKTIVLNWMDWSACLLKHILPLSIEEKSISEYFQVGWPIWPIQALLSLNGWTGQLVNRPSFWHFLLKNNPFWSIPFYFQ